MATNPQRRILITGVSSFLGARLAHQLIGAQGVEKVVGVDLEPPADPVDGLEFIRADIQSPLIARVLASTEVDTIVHTNIKSSPGRLGGRSKMKENNVMGTLQLLAAAQRAELLRRVVVKSSTAVYGSSPSEPSIVREDHAARHVHLAGYGKDCAEAETYARDFGRRRPDVELVILRTQSVVGPTVATSMADYLGLSVVPTALGFDPRLQLLHAEDLVQAFELATFSDRSGIYNIAADGVVFLSQAIRMMGALPLPLPAPAAQSTAAILRRMGLIDFPTDQIRLILFGRVVDIARARAELGFRPVFSTEECLRGLKAGSAPDADRVTRLEGARA